MESVDSAAIWALLMFELWHRTFIDRNLSANAGLTCISARDVPPGGD